VRHLPGVKSGGVVGRGGSVRRGSSGMQQMLWNSLGRVAVTGRTFWSTCLYLKTRTDGSAGGNGGNMCGVMVGAAEGGKGEVVELQTEIILTAGAHPV